MHTEHTELRIEGANCPDCLNATLDAVRALPGVAAVTASSTAGCLVIDQTGVDESLLAAVLHDKLHGTATFGAELVMVAVDPITAELNCTHCNPGGDHGH